MKPVLVGGDSFAVLDPTHGHWAHSVFGNTKHVAMPGDNHVSICTKLNSLDLTKYRVIVYHITSFTRAECFSSEVSFAETLDRLIDFDSQSDSFERLVSEMKNSGVGHFDNANYLTSPSWLDKSKGTKMKEFYSSVSTRWLLKANFNSMMSLIHHANSVNIPIVLVMSPFFNMNFESLQKSIEGKADFTLFDANIKRFEKEIQAQCELSNNHVGKKYRDLIVEKFKTQHEDLI